MAECLILGSDYHTSDVVKLLATSQVSCRGILPSLGTTAILEMCRREPSLVVIGVFCKDFPNDGVDLLQIIRKAHLTVKVHVFYESMDSPKDKYDMLSNEILSGFPIRYVDAASVIKRRWFPSKPDEAFDKKVVAARTHVVGKKPPTAIPITPVRPIESSIRSPAPTKAIVPVAREPVHEISKPRPAPVHKETPKAVPLAVADKYVVPKVQPPLVAEKEVSEEVDLLDEILTRIKKNSPLPKEPVRVDISGMTNNTSTELDPRRIKPLRDNPRWVTNPGFRPDSLRRLGESMKTIGQVETILVCPIVGDPDYDAQLLDGERRHKAATMVGIMLHASIRTEIAPDMEREMYILSVVRNTEKVPHTTLEEVGMVMKFRSFGLTIAQVAKFFDRTSTWVVQRQMLGQLHPDVQLLLDEGSDGLGSERKLTAQLALLLHDVELEKQLSVANEILASRMLYPQARRHVLNVRRGLGLKGNTRGRNKAAQHFQAMGTLTRRSIDAFGVFLDMPTTEMQTVLMNRTTHERNALVDSLREIVSDIQQLIKKVEMQE